MKAEPRMLAGLRGHELSSPAEDLDGVQMASGQLAGFPG
jgi:hypothetical protein